MTAFPNIEALAEGRVSGQFCEWPDMRREARSVVAEIAALREKLEKAEARVAVLTAALCGLVGSSDRAELEQMAVLARVMPAPDVDKAASLNAIHALLAATGPLDPEATR